MGLTAGFGKADTVSDNLFISQTAGVLSKGDWLAKKEELESNRVDKEKRALETERKKEEKMLKRRKKERKAKAAALSFNNDDEGEDEDLPAEVSYGKDPTIDTTFLPSIERERKEQEAREEAERLVNIERQKHSGTPIELTVISGGKDGGTRHQLSLKLGDLVSVLLTAVLKGKKDRALATAFSSDDLILVVDNLLISNNSLLFDLTRACNTLSGTAIFDFSKTKPHVLLRRWYNNKTDSSAAHIIKYDISSVYKLKSPGIWEVHSSS